MAYLKQTLKYFYDKGPQLVLLSIIPALLTPFLLSPSSALYYLIEYKNIEFSSFAKLYTDMRVLPYDFFYLGVLGIILFVLAFSLLFGIVDRHMRVGEFTISFRRAKTRLNYNIITALKFVATVAVLFELTNLMTAALYYLWAAVFGSGVTWLVFSTASLLLVSALFLFGASAIILWPPFMLHTGLKSADAFRMGCRQISGKTVKVALSILVVVFPFQLIMLLTGIFRCGIVVRTVLDGVCYAILIPYYVTLMYTIFYDVTGTERMDLQKIDIWSKKASKY